MAQGDANLTDVQAFYARKAALATSSAADMALQANVCGCAPLSPDQVAGQPASLRQACRPGC